MLACHKRVKELINWFIKELINSVNRYLNILYILSKLDIFWYFVTCLAQEENKKV